MTRARTLRLILFAAACVSASLPAIATAQERKPNIVIFLADDLGYQDTGPYGDKTVRTPNLDRLAKEGVAFDQAFVASPACAPSRAALLTGLMPARTGAEANPSEPRSWVRKLPSYLQEQGYEVVAFGKVSHYQQTAQYGFDHFEHDTFHDPEGIPSSIRWLKARNSSKPLAIFVGSNWPHVPWPATTEGYDPSAVKLPALAVDTPITRTARAQYDAAVTRMDSELGSVLDTVDRTLGKNTIVLFSSDHGAQWPFAKWNLYDAGIRVPMIVRWAGTVRPGMRTDAMVSWIDILPTLVDMAGGKPPVDIDGKSFAPLLRGTAPGHRDAIFTTHDNDQYVNVYPMRSVRTGRWKYIRNLHPDYVYTTHIDQFVQRPGRGNFFPSWREAAMRDPAAKKIVARYYHRPAEELYDLKADPDERVNLAGDKKYSATLEDLRTRLEAWRNDQGDTVRVKETPHLKEGPIGGAPDPQVQDKAKVTK
ncbi:sulfatase family protein [Massilia cavernae]|uniref:Arylsulfatase A family protein n=1 Tax=Massilia cavernae TaxID=2320864 RepID=A0A418Y8B3_9BURK|nr:sulfatase [Massilia cavernae]RJG27486.1 arylsulfatase A family protein [Massilia cavernae]